MLWRLLVLVAALAPAGTQQPSGTPLKPLVCRRPEYPSGLHEVEGKVDAKVSVAADGSVRDVTIVTTIPSRVFAASAVAALRQWRFSPEIKNGVAVESTYQTPVYFTPPGGMAVQFGMDSRIRSRVAVNGDVLTMTGGGRRIRSLLSFADFELTGEVRLGPEADALLRVRTWAEADMPHDEAPAIVFASRQPARQPGVVVVGSNAVRPVRFDAAAAAAFQAAASDWQPFEISCVDRVVRVSLGGRVVNEVELGDVFAGRISVDVRKGQIELRQLRVTRLDQYRDIVPLDVRFSDLVPMNAPNLVMPLADKSPRPTYLSRPMRGDIKGMVTMEAVIETDGAVGRVRVTGSLNEDADAAAVGALREWHFTPARLNGAPVRCLIRVQLSFDR